MLIGLSMPAIAWMLLAGVILDLVYGELPRWHPLVGFGRWATWVEQRLNRQRHLILRGLLAWIIVVLPLVGLVFLISKQDDFAWLGHIILLYFCIGLRSLRDHNLPILMALKNQDLEQARQLTSRIVSRDTANATAADLAKASTESMLENGNDAVFGTLFWFVLAGGAGALLFRLANTLDAMWGYRNARFNYFGRVAARVDDVMNWIPARLTALSYVLLAPTYLDKRCAWHCWRSQAPNWPSPNAGPVMASGAGALGLALGGTADYGGITEQRPSLGEGRAAQGEDILRAWHLVLTTTVLWLAIALAAGAVFFVYGGMDGQFYA
ncbi:adenosylcobinamide-phosphate synthase CbiB [Solimicrobium silvestre]|uniref:Cobalamin biosynthesis protein CobD n=1 Tax=Solimicrobium silvestre TaxID=2099400 RepID=A0A2S9GUZ0_9BURK|nr:adenosylcobinamide-phosphate synthase CbiB [Solimicrobium silvestre]PRC91530.1 cobD: cobalamin biosynthesis protein CobD [Solimicrobium silvestre]